jgi:hypothetical protein
MDIMVDDYRPLARSIMLCMPNAGIVKKGSGFIPKIKAISFKGLTDCGLAGALLNGLFLSQQDE